MSMWQIVGVGNFDDGHGALPGEEGFNTDAVRVEAKGKPFNWLGQSPGYVAPAEPAVAE